MKQGTTFLASSHLILYREGFWGERVTAWWEIGTWTKYMRLVHSFCVEGNPRSQQILMVPCMFLMLRCMAFCGAAWWGLQLQWFGVHAVQGVASGNCQKESQAYSTLGEGQMKADIASAVSLLTKQPRALLGQRPAVGTRCTMLNTLNTQTSLRQQICSLWSSILMIKSLPVVTLVWAVMARVWPKTWVLSVSSQTTSMLLNVAEIHTMGCYLGIFKASVLDRYISWPVVSDLQAQEDQQGLPLLIFAISSLLNPNTWASGKISGWTEVKRSWMFKRLSTPS